ncbi:MAG: diguanylate cyclase [Epsilonproteobacteria bacterium]|nr:diguanylate cyclase [Campylobacterota bacterium]
MKFLKIDSIAKNLLLSIFIMLTIVLAVFGSWWVYKKFDFFHQESERIKKEDIESKKKLLKEEIEKLSLQLNYEKKLARQQILSNIKYCAKEVYDIVYFIYMQNKNENTDFIKKQIASFLKQKFKNKKLFVFETNNNFKPIILNIDPSLNDKPLSKIKNEKEEYPFVNLALSIKEKKKGFYDINIKLKDKILHLKTYNIYFSPLGWNIGCAENKDKIKEIVKNRLIERYKNTKEDTKTLCNVSLLELYNIKGGKNFAKYIIQKNKPRLKNSFISDNLKDAKGVEIAKKYLKDLREKKESFFIEHIKTKEGEIASKLIYYKLLPEWNWIIGGTICLAQLEKTIQYQEMLLREYIINKSIKFALVFGFALLISFLVAKYFSKKIQNSFETFNDFFQKAAKTFVKIDPRKFYFKEFKDMAKSANRMIEEYKKAKRELEFSQQYLQLMLDTQESIVIVTNSHLISANKSFYKFFGFKDYEDFNKKHDCICEFFVNKGDEYITRKINGEAWFRYVYKHPETIHKVVMKKGDKEHVFVLTSQKMDYIGEERYVVVFTDITEVEKQRKNFQLVATTDPLIKISNRLKFDSTLDKEIENFKKNKKPFSLIFFDIDHFKSINDKYGHKTGDKILIELAKLVSSIIRKSDTFARWGGEEFAIILPGADIKKAYEIAEKIRKEIEKHDFNFEGKVTCSFGVTQVKEADTATSIITRVDEALYEAKRSGRNRVVKI